MVMTKFVGIPKHTNVAPHEYKRIRYQTRPSALDRSPCPGVAASDIELSGAV